MQMKKKKTQLKSNGDKLSPTPVTKVRVQTAYDLNRGKKTEKFKPRKEENVVELLLPDPPQSSLKERSDESERPDFTEAMLAEFFWKKWQPRLEKYVHFEKWVSLSAYEVEFHILFFWGRILVSAADLVRAANLADDLGTDIEFTEAEIINTVDARDIIVVPVHSENIAGAFGGTYIPLELLVAMLLESGFADDVADFHSLIADFEERKAWHQEKQLQEIELRKARLQLMDPQNLRRKKAGLRRAMQRSQKRNA